jgi:hypothetical protein
LETAVWARIVYAKDTNFISNGWPRSAMYILRVMEEDGYTIEEVMY